MSKIEGGLRTLGKYKKNLKNEPLISIITTNLNSKNFKKTIDSVKKLKYKNIDYIIIDGGSTKKAIDLLKKNNRFIDYWVSEKDRGIWHAYNKGYKLARGKYIGILPSDDIIYPRAINYLKNYITIHPDADFIVGSVLKNKVYAGFDEKKIDFKFNLLPSFVIGFFIKKKSLKKVGYLNEKYKYCADYDLLYRMVKKYNLKGVHTKHTEVFGKFKLGGYSSKAGFFKLLFWELKVRYDNEQNILWLIFIFFGKIYKKIYYNLIK